MIIDGHAHIYPENNADKIVRSFTDLHNMEPTASVGKGTIGDLYAKMQAAETNYTVLANFAPVRSVDKVNEWTLSIADSYEGIIPLISVYPYMELISLEKFFEAGAKGVKMHNGIQDFDPSDKGLAHIYEYCEENGIPITFHCGETSRVHMNEYTDISHIIPVVKKYKHIPFVLTHLAAGDPDTVFSIAEECPNVTFDTSITMTGEKCIYRIHDNYWEDDNNVTDAFRKIGCHRVAFGSDYPFGNPINDIKRICSLDLTEEEKEQILGKNSYKLYFKDQTTTKLEV